MGKVGKTFIGPQREAWRHYGKGSAKQGGSVPHTEEGRHDRHLRIKGLRRKIQQILNPLTENRDNYFKPKKAGIYAKSEAIKKAQETIARKLLRFGRFGKGAKLLDAGCGSGFSTEVAAGKGYDVTGIDMSAEMVKTARQRGIEKIFLMDMRNLTFGNEVFDGIISASALHWAVPSAGSRAAAKKVADGFLRVLKPNGRAAIQFFPQISREQERWLTEKLRMERLAGKARKSAIERKLIEEKTKIAKEVFEGFRDAGFKGNMKMTGHGCYMVLFKE